MNRGPFDAFLRDRLQLHPALVCPMRVLWREYLSYCREWGFEPATAEDFVACVRMEEGTEVRTGGSGRIRRVVVGIGFRASDRRIAA